MQLWEYCEVAWTPKQVVIRIYSQNDTSMHPNIYQGVQKSEEWGALLAQLGADGWEMTGVVPTKPADHTLYYFKRPMDNPKKVEWKERTSHTTEQKDRV